MARGGLRIPQLRGFYNEIIRLSPKIIVLDIGSNDMDTGSDISPFDMARLLFDICVCLRRQLDCEVVVIEQLCV